MNINLCKNCNKCSFKEITKQTEISLKAKTTINDEWFVLVNQCDEDGAIYHNYRFIPINKPINKILKRIYTDDNERYFFYDRISELDFINRDDFFRNIYMKNNNICPYYTEHYLSDIEHKERKKSWKKKMKLRNKVVKNGI